MDSVIPFTIVPRRSSMREGGASRVKLIVFGATGKTGQHVWQKALGRGHDVTAFTRSPHKLERSAGLRIAQGDVTDAASGRSRRRWPRRGDRRAG